MKTNSALKANWGLRAHDYGTLPAEQLAAKIATANARCVQLALAKALPDGPMFPGTLDKSAIVAIHSAFAQHHIDIAVLGCYIDMVTFDKNEREKSLARFEDHLAIASQFNCSIVGTETGSPIPYLHQRNGRELAFRESLASLTRLVKRAEALGNVCVGLEPVANHHALSSCNHVRIMLQEINSPALGIIFDPVNLIPETGIAAMDEFLDECFATFGHKIVAIHAKDFVMDGTPIGKVKSGPLPAGKGDMDWEGLFSRLINAGKSHVPILLEEAGPADAPGAFSCLQKAWDSACNKISAKSVAIV